VTADHGNAEEMINYEKIRQADGSFDYTLRSRTRPIRRPT